MRSKKVHNTSIKAGELHQQNNPTQVLRGKTAPRKREQLCEETERDGIRLVVRSKFMAFPHVIHQLVHSDVACAVGAAWHDAGKKDRENKCFRGHWTRAVDYLSVEGTFYAEAYRWGFHGRKYPQYLERVRRCGEKLSNGGIQSTTASDQNAS